VLEVVAAFEKVSGVSIPYQLEPRRLGDIAEFYADAQRALEVLGWQAKHSLEQMCVDSWHWQQANPNGYSS